MKAILALALIVCVAFSNIQSSYSDEELYTMWQEWKQVHHKRLADPETEMYRFEVFRSNVYNAFVLQQNDKDAQYGLTEFADLTTYEFEAMYLGYNPSLALKSSEATEYQTSNVAAPDSWDWTTQQAVVPVKNQGQCGSCWAFSTTGTLEGQNAIKHKVLLPLSEQQLVDCDKNDQGCNGGLMDNAFTWLKANGGIQKETDYPYKGYDTTCKFDKTQAVLQVTGFSDIKKGDEDAMLDGLFTSGPLAIAIHANGLQLYSGGIFNPVFCSKQLNHGVLGVGYGNEGGKNFWKIKNSWGASWGEKGFFRIVRGKDMCGLADATSIATVE